MTFDLTVSAFSLNDLPSYARRMATVNNLWKKTNNFLVRNMPWIAWMDSGIWCEMVTLPWNFAWFTWSALWLTFVGWEMAACWSLFAPKSSFHILPSPASCMKFGHHSLDGGCTPCCCSRCCLKVSLTRRADWGQGHWLYSDSNSSFVSMMWCSRKSKW